MIRVLHIVVAGAVGGAERVLADLATHPEETGAIHAAAVIAPDARIAGFLAAAGVAVEEHRRPPEGPLADLAVALGRGALDFVAGSARRHGASLLHLHTFGSHLLGARAARALDLPFIRTEHSTRVYRDLSCWPLSRGSLARAAAVVAVSDYVRRVAARRTQRPIEVVRNGVDLARFPARPFPGSGRVAIVGRLDRRKGVDRALGAAARVPGVAVDVVGDGPGRAGLERLAARLGVRARFHGHLADPRPVLAGADALLAAPRDEALSVALLEGMATGRAAIAVPVGGLPEIVRPGVSGLLAEEDDIGALAGSLAAAGSDRAALAALGASARRFVEAEASIESMCRGYAPIYARVTRGPAPPPP